ncbi:hypothetical protein Adt_09738 [Abeliophyllum distichum]|uniref:Uncharacterized protein n=1 Tax=Abeliophyllum distichum TaxID=126358 RepID=A0ABD1UI08_9LAMI
MGVSMIGLVVVCGRILSWFQLPSLRKRGGGDAAIVCAAPPTLQMLRFAAPEMALQSTATGGGNSSASTISANINSIPMLSGSNFKDWKENVLIVLGYMDLDLALRIEKLASLTDASSPDDRRNFEKWERSNRMSLMIIKRGIPEAFRGAVSEEVTNAKEFLAEIEKHFAKNDKAETSTLLQSLISMKYKSKENIREYIMQMSHTASKLKALKLNLSDDLLVHLVLISLPAHFNQFKVNYNCQKEKWTLNELISYCVQEEERLKLDKTEITNLASTSKDKGKKRKIEYETAKRVVSFVRSLDI